MTPEPKPLVQTPDGRFEVFWGLEWRGKFEGKPVRRVVQVERNFVLMLEHMAFKEDEARNVVCVDPQGNVLWRAELPTTGTPDCYTELRLQDGHVKAFSASCYFVQLNPDSGRIDSKLFTK